MARQQTLKHHLVYLRRCGIVQVPTDEGDPQTAAEVAREHPPDAGKDEHESKEAADIRRDERCPSHVLCDGPDEGTEYAAAVQWKAGNQIEKGQPEINEGQILRNPPQWLH